MTNAAETAIRIQTAIRAARAATNTPFEWDAHAAAAKLLDEHHAAMVEAGDDAENATCRCCRNFGVDRNAEGAWLI
jgi:hypothetical protein